MSDKSIVLNTTKKLSDYTSAELTLWRYDDDGEERFSIDRQITTTFDFSEEEFAHVLDGQFTKLFSDDDPAYEIIKEMLDARNN